jgi:hypothetical protein
MLAPIAWGDQNFDFVSAASHMVLRFFFALKYLRTVLAFIPHLHPNPKDLVSILFRACSVLPQFPNRYLKSRGHG